MSDAFALEDEFGDALRAALGARDPEALRRYLAPDVRWGDPGEPGTCHGPDEVIATMRESLAGRIEATLDEVLAGTTGVMAAITVSFPGEGEWTLYQVYDVADGLVTEIRRFDDVASAREAAGVPAER